MSQDNITTKLDAKSKSKKEHSVSPRTQTDSNSELYDSLEKNLNSLLANEYTLFTKTLKYHWNVTGPRFYSIHGFLETHYKVLLEQIDGLAERIRENKNYPVGTMVEFSTLNSIAEHPGSNPDASMMMVDLLKGHNQMREQIKMLIKNKHSFDMSPSTEDFLIGLLTKHDEMAWMLRSSLN